MRGRFWCKFRFRCGQNLWVMGVYRILEVWVKRGSTVLRFILNPEQATVVLCNLERDFSLEVVFIKIVISSSV
jgi:hypothetical protein